MSASSRRDAGFSIFYMGINVGAFAGQLITGFLGEKVGWHWGFGAAGVGMLFGLVFFAMTRGRTLRGIGATPTRHPDAAVQSRQERTVKIALAVGRGTSTFDGLSIAWSVAEYLHDQVQARSLFATHYHELTELAERLPGALLFTGEEGIGKRLFALEVARALNCRSPSCWWKYPKPF